MPKRIVGLDIGQTMLRAVELEDPDKARPKVVRYREVAIPEGVVDAGEVIETNTVATLLRRLWIDAGFKTKEVAIGIGNQKVLARDLTIPRQSRALIRESLPMHVQDLLPVAVDDALMDFYPISEGQGEHGPVLTGLLVAAVKSGIEANIAALKEAGLSPVDVDLIPFAMQRAVGTTTPETSALIDIGAVTTNIVLVTGGVPQFVRIIPIGGDAITRGLAAQLEVDVTEAESLKRTIGMDPAGITAEQQQIARAVFELSGELLYSIRNTLNYFANSRPNVQIGRITLTGGGARLRGIIAVLAEMTRTPVDFGNPFQKVGTARGYQAPEPAVAATMAVSVGLALGSGS
ncbi:MULTISPECIES: type IV pilus assembly protein PilM [unclassified Cryobacterium]|uniref:type IV pilus assembly protein PilM n=1 Tax=unclassified Cryobacterium TaxID=2649013 RepID=UPI00144575E1|nr:MULTISPECIES: type IV pilus assembly protein PilM [unclassified Cryobacterium]